MKYLLACTAALTMLIPALGCCCPNFGDGVADTRRERQARHKAIVENDCKQLVDDWDYFWLMDEKTRLSRWEIRP